MNTEYLFIVGLGRSGTKLVQNVLRLSSEVTVVGAGETRYLGKLFARGMRTKIARVLSTNGADPTEAIADVCINESPGFSVWTDLKSGAIPRAKLIDELAKQESTERGVYNAILRLRASPEQENVLHVDKTPQNLYHLDQIMSWFPRGKAIHMIRDPRAVLASAWTKRMKLYPRGVYLSLPIPKKIYSAIIVVHVALTWRYAVRLHNRYAKRYPDRYLLTRFEDLVTRPESAIRELTAFFDIDYHPSMTEPRSIGSSFGQRGSGMDEDALTRWQAVLKPWMTRLLLLFCARPMRRVGYDPST